MSPDSPAPYLASAARRRRLASISIDLDPLFCYYTIHGLGTPPAQVADVVLRRGLPRFLELFSRHGIRATFFVVGSDVTRNGSGALLTACIREGHELGNHSQNHLYDLARQPRDRIEQEVGACHEALRTLLAGQNPKGFRSPGYDISADLLDVVEELGYRYDSSLFPCPAYYAAKAARMAAMAVLGRRSGAVMVDPASLLAPADPYRPDPERPYLRGQALLVELPVAVTPFLRLPAIGTFLFLSERLRIHLLESMRGRPFFNLELHGLDLIDAEEDGIPTELVARQPDLRVPLRDKLRALHATLDRLRAEYELLPLHEVAEEVHRTGRLSRPLS